MEASIFSGVVNGAKRVRGVPSRPMRNLVKFHLIRPPSTPGNACLDNETAGVRRGR